MPRLGLIYETDTLADAVDKCLTGCCEFFAIVFIRINYNVLNYIHFYFDILERNTNKIVDFI